MAPPEQHRTPLRRISQGSLSALARSTINPNSTSHNSHAASGGGVTRLEFLAPALSDLADEMASMHSNMENLNKLSDVLETFNESFASYLYAMKMNAYCVEWEQAPTDISFIQAARAAEEARKALEVFKSAPTQVPDPQDQQPSNADETYMTAIDTTSSNDNRKTLAPTPVDSKGKAKARPPSAQGAAKAKLTIKEKKAREMKVDRVIQTLPIEFRGSDPDLRRVMEKVIGVLMDSETGKKVLELVKPPDLSQARVNKCLIALVNRKIVIKDSHGGVARYTYVPT